MLKDILYAAARASHKVERSQSNLNVSELSDGLVLANQLADQWSSRTVYSWSDNFVQYTLTAGHQPHLLGPGLTPPDFALPVTAGGVRPERLYLAGASLILPSNVDTPLNVRDDDWWAGQNVKSITSSVPTDIYYSGDWPNGELWLWPVPSTSCGIRLRLRSLMGQFTAITDTFTGPPAYEKAFTLSLAEEMCDWWGLPVPPGLPARAARARVIVQINNIRSPRTGTADIGTRCDCSGGDFNWTTGGPS
jgi:hypothetical protein